jgi:hypothetical protein
MLYVLFSLHIFTLCPKNAISVAVEKYKKLGRPTKPAIPCGLCGERLHVRTMRKHYLGCPVLLGVRRPIGAVELRLVQQEAMRT